MILLLLNEISHLMLVLEIWGKKKINLYKDWRFHKVVDLVEENISFHVTEALTSILPASLILFGYTNTRHICE